jgi:hypothetical protein
MEMFIAVDNGQIIVAGESKKDLEYNFKEYKKDLSKDELKNMKFEFYQAEVKEDSIEDVEEFTDWKSIKKIKIKENTVLKKYNNYQILNENIPMEYFKGEDYYDRMAYDKDALRELELYAENDGTLYRQRYMPTIENIKRKVKSDKYDHKKAPKLWMYYVDEAAKKYVRDMAPGQRVADIFSKKDREVLSQKLADWAIDEVLRGNYN